MLGVSEAASRDQDGQVVVRVGIAVAQRCAVDDRRLIKQRSAAGVTLIQATQQRCKFLELASSIRRSCSSFSG